MSLDSAKAQFIDDFIAALESGHTGNKRTVAENVADALIALVKAATVTTSVTGVCPSGGGPLSGGQGVGGVS